MPEYLVVTEHWPRNPSKPVWLHVESRPMNSVVSAELWATSSAQSRKRNYPSRCTGKTFVVRVLEGDELRDEMNKEVAQQRAEYFASQNPAA